GHDVGELAKLVWKGGVEVMEEYFDITGAITSTEEFVEAGKSVIYEATAMSPDGLYSKIDILKKVRGTKGVQVEWDLIEVKASTRVKDYHIWDMASQRLAFEGAGYKIRKSVLMHVNNQYVRDGELDAKEFFHQEDCTEEVLERMAMASAELPSLLDILKAEEMPECEVGGHCSSPFSCDYIDHCWEGFPDYSVYDVTSRGKLDNLLEQGIVDVKDIPDGFVGGLKEKDIQSYKTGKVLADKANLGMWASDIEYPLYFLDFETINPAIPPCDGMSPYKQYPFQFSLHVQQKRDGELEHFEYLHTEASDPQRIFAEKLVELCGDKGSVVVYNQSFESRVNSLLAEKFPDLRKGLFAINHRMIDLLVPFQKRWLHHPDQLSSASIKAVLPAFCPELSYSDLDVSDGGEASRIGAALIAGKLSGEDLESASKGLRDYCGLDTMAMVKLLVVVYNYLAKEKS
ncbi:MAG: DUF2779 domain-containing protein, partial [Bacteriovoracaceae bacterium]|nr:DUF2779 domain-containing protein [Bacteriovoracaceae bacterium]